MWRKMDFKTFLSQDLSVIKKELNSYILKRENGNNIFFNLFYYNCSLEKIKYVLKYCYEKYTSLILEINNYGNTILCYSGENENCSNFLKYNFTEISESTNNFILPLTMEIQN